MVVEEGIKYRYEFSDDKSNKFWEIVLNGNTYSVSYGRIGNKPQTKTKEFESFCSFSFMINFGLPNL